MIIYKCIELPDQEFSSRQEMFHALKEAKDEIISLKKATIKEADSVKVANREAIKARQLNMKDGFVYPVINTTLYMDSHNDVHADGIWNVSLKQQKGNIFYVADHKLETTSVIAFRKDVNVMVRTMAWKDLGYDAAGNTEALMFEIQREKIRLQVAREIINDGIDIEHSVRMQYVQLGFAVNSEDPDFKAEKALWNKHINKIVNKEVAEDRGYFWWISEAKIFKEGSMVVMGSNDITPMLISKSDPGAPSHDPNPPKGSSENECKSNNYLLNY